MANDQHLEPPAPPHLRGVFEILREMAGASQTGWDANTGVWEVRGTPSGTLGSPWAVNGVDNDEAWFVCGEVRIAVPLRGPSAGLAGARLADLAVAFEAGSVVRSQRRTTFGHVVQVRVPGTLTDGCLLRQGRWMTRTSWL